MSYPFRVTSPIVFIFLLFFCSTLLFLPFTSIIPVFPPPRLSGLCLALGREGPELTWCRDPRTLEKKKKKKKKTRQAFDKISSCCPPALDGHLPAFPLRLPALDGHLPAFPLRLPALDGHLPAFPLRLPALDGHLPAFPLRLPALDGHLPWLSFACLGLPWTASH